MRYLTTWGKIRGCCGHLHRTIEAAEACLARHMANCRSKGEYSDRRVFMLSGWEEICSYGLSCNPGTTYVIRKYRDGTWQTAEYWGTNSLEEAQAALAWFEEQDPNEEYRIMEWKIEDNAEEQEDSYVLFANGEVRAIVAIR